MRYIDLRFCLLFFTSLTYYTRLAENAKSTGVKSAKLMCMDTRQHRAVLYSRLQNYD